MSEQFLTHVPICACRTIRPIGVNTYHKQFLLSQRSAFVLACSYYHSIVPWLSRLWLSIHRQSTHTLSTACGQPFYSSLWLKPGVSKNGGR